MIFKPGEKVALVGEVLNTYESDSSMMVRLSDGQAIHTQISNGRAEQERAEPVATPSATPAQTGEEKPKTNTPASDAKPERKRTPR